MGKTSIEWCDMSVNPIRARLKSTGDVGHYCEKIAPGCAHCYSSNFQKRFGLPPFGAGQHRDEVEIFLAESKLDEVRRRRKPTKWFWCDMTDFFGDWMEADWLRKCFDTMDATPQHTHMLLTKRPENIRKMWCEGGIPHPDSCERSPEENAQEWADRLVRTQLRRDNVWLGTSVANQQDADENIPELLRCRDMSPVLFVSYEPAIGPVDFEHVQHDGTVEINSLTGSHGVHRPHQGRSDKKLDWIIVGGESGNNARGFDLAWARSAVDQCKYAGVPVFVKQMGSRPFDSFYLSSVEDQPLHLRDSKGGDMDEWPVNIRVREFPPSGCMDGSRS